VNLIKDKWIPVRRADSTPDTIAPWEIGASENPVIDIAAPRPDFRGALYQFLIGLVQTAFAPEEDDEWEEKWKKTPKCEELRKAFEKFSEAFELDAENGQAFMQDKSITELEELPIEDLVGGALSANTRKDNKDLFTKRGTIKSISPYWAALALFQVQTSGVPAWGQHRVGLRPGGPVTTLLRPEENVALFQFVWANILSIEDMESLPGDKEKVKLFDIFPWLGKIRYSPNKEKTAPLDANPLQHYWPLPRRIRLLIDNSAITCSLTGILSPQGVSKYLRQVDGVFYSDGWIHPLTPYENRSRRNFPSAITGDKLKEGYSIWLPLTIGVGDFNAAKIVAKYNGQRFPLFKCRLWAFGYEAESANTKAWYESIMPLVNISDNKRLDFVDIVRKSVDAAVTTSEILIETVKQAWFGEKTKTRKYPKGDYSFVTSAFWETTESGFFSTVEQLRAAIESDKPTASILSEWRNTIISAAEKIFDRFALNSTDEPRNMKRIALAAKALSAILRSEKTKSINALKEVA
jgi:CRISPR system Cascade subunit CasA